jgi:DNA-binding NarL/FixJ family response regulator
MLKARQKTRQAENRRVLVMDDQPIVRERVTQIVRSEPDLAVCGEADDAHEAFKLVEVAQPHLVITSLSLKNCHGLDFVKDLHSRYPQLLILVFSMYDETVYAERAIRAGARGFIRKHESTDELRRAIRWVLDGEIYMSDRVTVTKVTQFFARSSSKNESPTDGLSNRELQVLQLVGQGQTTRQIAAALHVDIKTIETYRARIKIKLNVASGTELAEQARKWLEQTTRGY